MATMKLNTDIGNNVSIVNNSQAIPVIEKSLIFMTKLFLFSLLLVMSGFNLICIVVLIKKKIFVKQIIRTGDKNVRKKDVLFDKKHTEPPYPINVSLPLVTRTVMLTPIMIAGIPYEYNMYCLTVFLKLPIPRDIDVKTLYIWNEQTFIQPNVDSQKKCKNIPIIEQIILFSTLSNPN